MVDSDHVQPGLHVRFGRIDVGHATRDLHTSTSIYDLPTADFVVDLHAVADKPLDYLAEVQISVVWEREEQLIFTGRVLSATSTAEGIALKCRGGVALDEQLVPPFATSNVEAPDLVHLITRSAGFPEERLRIDGLEDLPTEALQVAAPLTGVSVASPTRFGNVELVPAQEGERLLMGLSPPPDLRARFLGGEVYCVACVTARTVFDAEQAGLAEIDATVSWLAVRARYGLASLPGGEALSFRREHALARPAYGSVVTGFGFKSNRAWIRDPISTYGHRALPLHEFLLPPIPVPLQLQDRQAVLACRRAATETDPLGRITALWDAIEFYTAGASAPKLFAKAELKLISEAVCELELSELQSARIRDAVENLNSTPLMVRLRAALERDGVPVGDGELALLQRLRKLRNDAVHGRGAAVPEVEDIEYAVSVVSRMLAYRLHGATAD